MYCYYYYIPIENCLLCFYLSFCSLGPELNLCIYSTSKLFKASLFFFKYLYTLKYTIIFHLTVHWIPLDSHLNFCVMRLGLGAL